MLRVLHILHSMDHGGMQSLIMNIYRNIDRSKVQFDFMLHTEKECPFNKEIRELGGRIFSVPARNEGISKNRRALNDFFDAHREYKIVHQHVSSLSYAAPLKIAGKHNVPVRIIHSHNIREGGSPLHKYVHYFNRLFVKSYATDFFACSDLAAKWLYGNKQCNYRIINNGIQAEKFTFNEEKRNAKRRELGIKEGTFVLGHVGRFVYQKNHSFLVEIFKEVNLRNNNSMLLLVGDGELQKSIKQKAADLGLQDNVIFTGARTDVPDLMQAMDVFVFPSNYEGLGIVLVEAQASGLPCLTSSKVVPEEVDVTGMVKFLSLEESPQFWAQEALKFTDHKRENTLQKIIDAHYDIYKIAQELEKWYLLKSMQISKAD